MLSLSFLFLTGNENTRGHMLIAVPEHGCQNLCDRTRTLTVRSPLPEAPEASAHSPRALTKPRWSTGGRWCVCWLCDPSVSLRKRNGVVWNLLREGGWSVSKRQLSCTREHLTVPQQREQWDTASAVMLPRGPEIRHHLTGDRNNLPTDHERPHRTCYNPWAGWNERRKDQSCKGQEASGL